MLRRDSPAVEACLTAPLMLAMSALHACLSQMMNTRRNCPMLLLTFTAW